VGSEHRVHFQASDHVFDQFLGQARPEDAVDRACQPSGGSARSAGVGGHAVDLFGHIGQMEVRGERSHQSDGGLHIETVQHGVEGGGVC